jgi:hypothetical protein
MMMASYFNFFLPRPSEGLPSTEGTTSVTKQAVKNPAKNTACSCPSFGGAQTVETPVLLLLEFCFLLCLQLLDSILELVNVAIRNVETEACLEEASGEWARKPG